MNKISLYMKKVKERVPTWALLALAALVALILIVGFDTLLEVVAIGVVLAILSWSYLSDVKARTDLATQQSDSARIEQLCYFFRSAAYEFIHRDDISLMFCLVKLSCIDQILMNPVRNYGTCTVHRFSLPRPHGAPELTEADRIEFGNLLQQYVNTQLSNSFYVPPPFSYGNTPVVQIDYVFSTTHHVHIDVAVLHNGKSWEDFMRAQNSPPPSQNNDFSDWEL